jgi:predicted phage terminase large subunit-like protein
MIDQLSHLDVEAAESWLYPEQLERSRKNLIIMTQATMPTYAINWHHLLMWKYIRRWMIGEIPFLIIETPPRHGKTELISKRLAAFIFGREPDAQIISTSYSADLARQNNRAVQRIIDSESYNKIFPGTSLSRSNIRSLASGNYLRNSDEFEIVGHRGYYRSAGIGGGITGMGANYFMIDDPFKNRAEADSPTIRQAVWDWWTSTALTRLEKNARVLLINTRWHEDDLAGRLLAQAKADKDAFQWTRLRLPAIKEGSPGESVEDPRELGEALWPGKYSVQRLGAIRGSSSLRDWNALYQQNPSSTGGEIIKESWIKFYDQMPPAFSRMIQSWDMTFKGNDNNDYVVGQVWGVYSGKYFLMPFQVRKRIGFVDSCDEFRRMTDMWPRALAKVIEDKANGPAIIDTMRRGDPQRGLKGISGVIPYKPQGSKAERVEAVSPLFRAGDVYYPHPTIASWISVNVDEMVKFKQSGPGTANDDTVDATTQALLFLTDSTGNVLNKTSRL